MKANSKKQIITTLCDCFLFSKNQKKKKKKKMNNENKENKDLVRLGDNIFNA